MDLDWRRAIKAVLLAGNDGVGQLEARLRGSGVALRVISTRDLVPGDADFYILGQGHQNGTGSHVNEGHLKQMNPGSVLFCDRPSRMLRDLAMRYGLITEEPHERRPAPDYSSFVLQRMSQWIGREHSVEIEETTYPGE